MVALQLRGLHPDGGVGLKRKPPIEQGHLLFVEVESLNLGRFWQEDVKPHPFKVVSGFGLPPESCQGVLSSQSGGEATLYGVEGGL